jgi:hypothetical protein
MVFSTRSADVWKLAGPIFLTLAVTIVELKAVLLWLLALIRLPNRRVLVVARTACRDDVAVLGGVVIAGPATVADARRLGGCVLLEVLHPDGHLGLRDEIDIDAFAHKFLSELAVQNADIAPDVPFTQVDDEVHVGLGTDFILRENLDCLVPVADETL